MKYGVVTLAAAFAICAGPAFAAQNVANTSQKGSLLIYPMVTIDPTYNSDTFIEISNDATSIVHIECTYVNEQKGRASFDFDLTGKATASWDVKTLNFDVARPATFPNYGSFPGNVNRGELICFAVDQAVDTQIAFNNLSGTATVVILADTRAGQPKQALRYDAWSFVARGGNGAPVANNIAQGSPGTLALTGANDGNSYDACPQYNIATFMPNGATLGNVTTLDNSLSVVSCNQDLKQDFSLYLTKLQYFTWNSHENSYGPSYQCVDSVETVGLDDPNMALVNPQNFDFSQLQTANARYMVQGVKSSQCYGSVPSGLLGVATAMVALGGDAKADQEIGSTSQTAGVETGFVYWDPQGATPLSAKP
jgi:hypothetical protein